MKLKLTNLFALCASVLAIPFAVYAADQPMEEVVVTGSLIKGTPVDAALPVEVYSAADLQDVGAPTALEFVKSLTVSGPTTGESYYFTGAQLNNDVGINLRGLGADKTLTLLNGRRMPGNSTNGATNSSTLPQLAVARIELLKDGAAVTYGADATGGVVNFITRNSFVGFEMQTSYKGIGGSNGDWNLGGLAGFGEGDTNVMFSFEWDHRSELDTIERDFSSLPYKVNPAPWSYLTNLAYWIGKTGNMMTPAPTGTAISSTAEWGSSVAAAADFSQSSCEAVGGVYVVVPGYVQCKYGYIPFYNIVEETDTYRAYVQANSAISDSADFHFDLLWSRVHTPHIYGSPGQPVIRGPANTSGAAYQFWVPKTNPYVSEFATRSGIAAQPYYGLAKGFVPIVYRAFAHGGNPAYASEGNWGVPTEIDYRYWHSAASINGTMFQSINYDVAATVNHWSEFGNAPDVVGSRLQEAMNGFGGPDCNVPDLNPDRWGTQNDALAGTGNCMWWNPFASSFKSQPILHKANPSYMAGSENPNDLIRWVMNPRNAENVFWNVTLDFVLSGQSPLELGGGPVAWAVGTQWRDTSFREANPDPIFNGKEPCAWPGQDPKDPTDPLYTGCTQDEPGPFVFFSTDIPESLGQDQVSYFLELDLPILESLYVVAAARYEEFNPGGLDTTVYKVSAKWDVTNNLSFRGSYGTNYQAPGLGITPGEVFNQVNSYTVSGGNWKGAQQITETNIVPETATVWSAGAVWESEGFNDGSDVRIILDYWDIETEDELGLLASANTIANAVFSISPNGPGTPVPINGTALADCSHPMAARVTWNDGVCVQGVTTATDFGNITTAYGNGPGQHTAGYDLAITYGFPAFSGDLEFGVNATKVTKFEFTPTILDGIVLNPGDDRLGTLNFATIGSAAPELRANISVNYARDTQNFRAVFNFISGVDDERYLKTPLVPEGYQPGTTTPFNPTRYGVRGDNNTSLDFHYNVDLSLGSISASIVNVLDEDPPAALEELGYDPFMGSPLGRTFEIGWRKEF